MQPQKIAVVGLGLMGSALARALGSAGHAVVGWNRTPKDFADLREAGVALAATAHEAISAGDLVFLVTLDYPTTREVLEAVQGSRPFAGKTLVQFASGLPGEAEALARWVEARGGAFLDGALKVNPSDVSSGRGVMMYAGSRATFDAVVPTLSAFGPPQVHVGESPGMAKALDCIMLGRTYMWMVGYFECAAMARAYGIPVAEFTQAFLTLMVRVQVNIERAASQMEQEVYPPAQEASIDVHCKALRSVAEFARDVKVDTPMLDVALDYLERAVASGAGDRDLAACFREVRRRG